MKVGWALSSCIKIILTFLRAHEEWLVELAGDTAIALSSRKTHIGRVVKRANRALELCFSVYLSVK